ncbi:hypothetical protein PybrP1_007664 [[Pythium] brassicae (nom. inval.)]|nr:hypothetical protein PybrP1_007664 [[Pythium] brassicae (nom. inval.)]
MSSAPPPGSEQTPLLPPVGPSDAVNSSSSSSTQQPQSLARVQAVLSTLSASTGGGGSQSNASTPRGALAASAPAAPASSITSGRGAKPLRVGLDAAAVQNQQKWKRLADISDDNSTAKDMASEVQNEYRRQRRETRQQQQQQQQQQALVLDELERAADADGDTAPLAPLRSGAASLQDGSGGGPASPLRGGATTMEADRFLIAAAFVRDGIHGRKIGYRLDRTALLLNDLFHSASYRAVYMLVAGVSCLLAFVEQPGDGSLNDYLVVDVVCVLMFALDVALRWYMSSDETKRRFVSRQPWAYVRLLLVLLTCADMAANAALPAWNPNRYSRALRPYFLITRGRNIRIIFASCLRALREVALILLLTGCLIGFFGLLGFLVFSAYSDAAAAPFFLSLPSSLYTMLLVLNCLPYMVKSLYPYYKRSRWSALFFVVFVLLTNLFLLKLTIAASYRSYKQHTEKMLFKRLQKRKAALAAAFDILAQDSALDDRASGSPDRASGSRSSLARGSSRYFDRASPRSLSRSASMFYLQPPARQLSVASWVRLCEYLKPRWTSTEARLVFNTVDTEHTGLLPLSDFYQLCALLNVQVERSSARASLLRKLFKSARYARVKKLRARARAALLYETLLFGRYPVVVAELVVGVLICCSVLQAVQVNNLALAFSANHVWRVAGFALLLLFTLEVALKLFAFGRVEFFRRPFCQLDLAIAAVGWLFYALTSLRDDPLTISRTFYDLALAVRSLRILKLLNLVPPFRAILWTMRRIAALIVQLLLVILCVMYSFAVFTQAHYGAALRDFPPEKQPLAPSWYAVREEFQAATFDEALLTLFGVANLAGWDMVMDAAHAATGAPATYVFFFSYRITMANILLPIFVGFLVESFVSNAKAAEDSVATYVEAVALASEHQSQREENQLAVLQSLEEAAGSAGAGAGGPAGPASAASGGSSDGELRIKYQRRGSLVHNQMFDAVKLSDVSRLSLLVDKKDEELATQDRAIRRLESNALTMQSRAAAAQRLLLQYEAKMEELSAVLLEAKDELLRQQQQIQELQQPPQPALSTASRRASWRVWNP